MNDRITIAIDLDGTLLTENDDGEMQPILGAREALEKLKALGYYIVIYSCRFGLAARLNRLEDELKLIRRVLSRHGIQYDEIFLGEKLVADVYVDNRAISFAGDWTKTCKEVKNTVLSKHKG
jgi:histidinol phosphatase-like enzyme